jgi:hypothetical protein
MLRNYGKLESERIADIRQRLWGRLAGRPNPNDPTKTIPPTTEEMVALIGQAIRLSRHEAMLFGMDEPTKAQIVGAVVGQSGTRSVHEAGSEARRTLGRAGCDRGRQHRNHGDDSAVEWRGKLNIRHTRESS